MITALRNKEPLLVIGIGGTGLSGIMRVKHDFAERFGGSVADDGSLLYSDDLTEFIEFDSSSIVNCHAYGMKLVGNEYVNICRRNIQLNCDYIDEWFDHEASDMRQCGRLGVFHNFINVYNIIMSKLSNLLFAAHTAGASLNKVHVKLICGIGGCTGGGALLDLAYIIRYVAQQMNCNIEMDAYLLMPDLIAHRVGCDNMMLSQWNANAFSLLKELDYLMQAQGVVLEQRYDINVVIPWNGAPFDRVFLQNACNTQGYIITDAYETVVKAISEYITQSFEFGSKGEFSFETVTANSGAQLQMLFGDEAGKHCYNSIGMASNDDDLEHIELQEYYLMYDEIEKGMNRRSPDSQETAGLVERAFGKGVFDLAPGLRRIYRQRHSIPYVEEIIDIGMLRCVVDDIHGRLSQDYKAKLSGRICDDRELLTEAVWSNFLKIAEDVCKNTDYGPCYLLDLLTGHEGLIDCVYRCRSEVSARLEIVGQYLEDSLKDCNSALEAINRCNPVAWVLKKQRLYSEYCRHVERLLIGINDKCYLEAVGGALEIYSERLKAFVEKLYDAVKNLNEGHKEYSYRLKAAENRVWMIAGPWMVDELKEYFADTGNRNFVVQKAFETAFAIASGKASIDSLASELDSVRNTVFHRLNQTDFDTMVEHDIHASTEYEYRTEVKNKVCRFMDGVSAPAFDLMYGTVSPELKCITIYTDSRKPADAICGYCEENLQSVVIRFSKDFRRIVWLTQRYGIALNDMRYLKVMERDFQNSSPRFLYMGKTENSCPVKANWAKIVMA